MLRSIERDYKSAKLILEESEKTDLAQNERFLGFFAEIKRNTIQKHIPKILELVNGFFLCF